MFFSIINAKGAPSSKETEIVYTKHKNVLVRLYLTLSLQVLFVALLFYGFRQSLFFSIR